MAWGHRGFYEKTAKILDLKEDDNYLEIGFGSGFFIKKYAGHVSRIAGLDYSEDIVNLASSVNEDLVKLGKAEFRIGNVLNLPWSDCVFSVVVGIETLFFWSDPEAALKEIFRVLTDRGRLILEMSYNKDDGKDHSKQIKKYNLRLYSGEEMEKLFLKSGFCDIQICYYEILWIPFKGYIVPRGMIVKGVKGLIELIFCLFLLSFMLLVFSTIENLVLHIY